MRIEIGGLSAELQDRVDGFNSAIDEGDTVPEDRTELLADCRAAAVAAVKAQELALAQIEAETRSGLIQLGLGVESDSRYPSDPDGSEKRLRERVGTSVNVRQASGELARLRAVADRVDAIQRGMLSFS